MNTFRKGHIVIVERDLRSLLKVTLEQEGHRVEIFQRHEEAFQFWKDHKEEIDLIITGNRDMGNRFGSGITLIRIVRAEEKNTAPPPKGVIPIILYTADMTAVDQWGELGEELEDPFMQKTVFIPKGTYLTSLLEQVNAFMGKNDSDQA